jgi:hypothetical protein
MENMICIHTTDRRPLAIMLRDKLELEGIKAILLDKKDTTYGTFGELEIYVQPGDVEKARAIISATENE